MCCYLVPGQVRTVVLAALPGKERGRWYSGSLESLKERSQSAHFHVLLLSANGFFLCSALGAKNGGRRLQHWVSFHSCILHASEKQYFGVDLPSDLVTEMSSKGFLVEPYMRWGRLFFGWQSSPYLALRMHVSSPELCMGEPADHTSAFQWNRIVLDTTLLSPKFARFVWMACLRLK